MKRSFSLPKSFMFSALLFVFSGTTVAAPQTTAHLLLDLQLRLEALEQEQNRFLCKAIVVLTNPNTKASTEHAFEKHGPTHFQAKNLVQIKAAEFVNDVEQAMRPEEVDHVIERVQCEQLTRVLDGKSLKKSEKAKVEFIKVTDENTIEKIRALLEGK
jgi:hypothetical protein